MITIYNPKTGMETMKMRYDPKTDKWRKEKKEEVMQKVDIEGNKPCDICWKDARDNGVYVWPLKIYPDQFKRCKCGRMIGVK